MLVDKRAADPAGSGNARFLTETAASVAFWVLVYVALRELASILSVAFGISAWYPPAAISLLVMIRHGLPGAMGIFCATVFTSLDPLSAPPGPHNVAAALSHAVAYGVAAMVYRAHAPRHRCSLRPRSIRLLIVAALLGATLASVLGNLNHNVEFDGAHAVTFGRLFAWMVGDLFGVLSLCPFLMFRGLRVGGPRRSFRAVLARMKAPLTAILIAIAIAILFAVISRNADVSFRLVTVVGVGVWSVIVAHALSPRATLLYLFVISMLSAAWLSTEVAATARVEFAVQIVTFLAGSYAMLALSMDRARQRAVDRVRRLRIDALAGQRDALERRIGLVEREFAELAHELRTPLGGILGLLEITEGGVAAASTDRADDAAVARRERVAHYFRHMRGCALYLNALVDDAFDVARLSRASITPSITTVDLRDTLEALDLVALTRAGAGIVVFDPSIKDPLTVRTDRNRLLQILINLVVNAVRYAERPDSVRVVCSASADSVAITVENASSAVTQRDLERRIGGTEGKGPNSPGLGIGLPLVGRLSTAIGARVETRASHGVVAISVVLPRA